MVTFLAVSVVLIVIVNLFVKSAKFGKLPEGERKARIEKSPNYKNGSFQNLNATPQMTSDGGFLKILNDFRKAKTAGLR